MSGRSLALGWGDVEGDVVGATECGGVLVEGWGGVGAADFVDAGAAESAVPSS